MATRGRRARSRRLRQIIVGIAATAVALSALGTLTYVQLRGDDGALDETTLCPIRTGPLGHYVLLVDKTDPLNFTQKKSLSVTIEELVNKRLPEGYLLSVFVLGEDIRDTAEPLVELCNPGTGQDKSGLTHNLEWARRAYQEKFIKPLKDQTDALQSSQPAKWSPILEMLQLVAINGFRKHDIHGEKRLFLMSDMLHNAPQFSMFVPPLPDYKPFSSTDYGRKTQTDLHDVKVELYYLLHKPQLQTLRNQKFWEDYFEKAGARLVDVRPLEG